MIKNILGIVIVGTILSQSVIYADTVKEKSTETTTQSTAQPAKDMPKEVRAPQTLQNPTAVIESSIIKIQDILAKNASQLSNDPQALIRVIKKNLITHLDVNKIASDMLGEKWETATKAQQDAFINGFMNMLVLMYSKNVAQLGDYKIKFRPLRGDSWKTQDTLQISGIITKDGSSAQGSRITVYLIKSPQNQWKIYDVAAEGISIIQNYRSQFQSLSTVADAITAVDKVNARAAHK